MRKIRSVLRLHHDLKFSGRQIAKTLGISRDSASDYITRAAAAKLPWPLSADLDDADLEALLFPPIRSTDASGKNSTSSRKPEPNWGQIHLDMKRKGATLTVLHGEYLATYPQGICYSLFCERYNQYLGSIKKSMRQVHVAGEKVFVDYVGPTMEIVDPKTGEVRCAQIFVGVLGASRYIYSEAVWSQRLGDWVSAHARMFEHFGGAPLVIVPDNLKSAVTDPAYGMPVINTTFQNMAEHYGSIVVPARAEKPKDKALAENGVLIVERWIMFRLRNRIFTSLTELNQAIKELLIDVNNRTFKKLPGSRQSTFEAIDRPALLRLPTSPFVYAEFYKVRVDEFYRIEIGGSTYSVPSRLANQEVEIRLTSNTVEVLFRGKRVMSKERGALGAVVIDPNHLEPNHRFVHEWTNELAVSWANSIGIEAGFFLAEVLKSHRVKEQGMRAQTGLRKLVEDHGEQRTNAACRIAIEAKAFSISRLRSILKNKLDQAAPREPVSDYPAIWHSNVRGPGYFH